MVQGGRGDLQLRDLDHGVGALGDGHDDAPLELPGDLLDRHGPRRRRDAQPLEQRLALHARVVQLAEQVVHVPRSPVTTAACSVRSCSSRPAKSCARVTARVSFSLRTAISIRAWCSSVSSCVTRDRSISCSDVGAPSVAKARLHVGPPRGYLSESNDPPGRYGGAALTARGEALCPCGTTAACPAAEEAPGPSGCGAEGMLSANPNAAASFNILEASDGMDSCDIRTTCCGAAASGSALSGSGTADA